MKVLAVALISLLVAVLFGVGIGVERTRRRHHAHMTPPPCDPWTRLARYPQQPSGELPMECGWHNELRVAACCCTRDGQRVLSFDYGRTYTIEGVDGTTIITSTRSR